VPLTVPAVTVGLIVTVRIALTGLPQPLLIAYVITEVPALTPVITPVPATTVATPGVALLQLPPAVPFELNVVVAPIHAVAVPLRVPAVTVGLIVTVRVALTGLPQPLLIA